MIARFQLLRHVGQFASVTPPAGDQMQRLTLLYAENGRGKTTLAAILRSLATGDAIPVRERQRLGGTDSPHLVIRSDDGLGDIVFQNGAWSSVLPSITIYDDEFVAQNVCSGLAVDPAHRQNLHELILGAQGVALSTRHQQCVDQIEVHNRNLRDRAGAIPSTDRGGLSVEDFCALTNRDDIDQAIQDTERLLEAAQEQDPIRTTPIFEELVLPGISIDSINEILERDLPALDEAAAALVKNHIDSLGVGAESWISDGMQRLAWPGAGTNPRNCPFCAQDLAASTVINHYQAYFSYAYQALKQDVASLLASVVRMHGEEVPSAFERAVRVLVERRQFWSRFCQIPDVAVDTATIATSWRAARVAIVAALEAKQAAPLERIELTSDARSAVETYEADRQTISVVNGLIRTANEAVRLVKEQAATANPVNIGSNLSRLKAIKSRYQPNTNALCQAYLDEKTAKSNAERLRDQARTDLDGYRTAAFPGYQTSINLYLERFNAGFRLDAVTPTNTRSGPTCNYSLVINNVPVQVAGGDPTPGQTSFRNTLSAGDRNTLALAFFFSMLDQDPQKANRIVVIDDPVSSLDEHRHVTTVQEIRRLVQSVSQVIVLSHSKSFLCRIWEGAEPTNRVAWQIVRDGSGSSITSWDVHQDCITEHDRRHTLLRHYLTNGGTNQRDVAKSIRPTLEAFFRVAYPDHFPPGKLLGPFRNECQQRVGTQVEILRPEDITALGDLIEYSNRFHHDTNPAWETEVINDGELRGFVDRVLRFTRR